MKVLFDRIVIKTADSAEGDLGICKFCRRAFHLVFDGELILSMNARHPGNTGDICTDSTNIDIVGRFWMKCYHELRFGEGISIVFESVCISCHTANK